MAINWNQAEYVAPKLQIVPEQLPVEAGVKVGAVLQDRFDKSYENLTKAEEAARQLINTANPVDKEIATQVFNQYSEQLKGIDKTDLHNARWKTLKLATEAANNYTSMAQRNKEIQAQEEMISKNPIWGTTREERLKDFRKGLTSMGWDADKRTFANLNVSPYSAAADVNTMKKSVEYGALMKPETFGAKDGSLEYVDASGKTTKNPFDAALVYHRTQTGERKLLKDADIKSAVQNAMLNDSEVKAMVNRDLKYLGINPDNPEQAKEYNQYLQKTIFDPAKSAGELLKINDNTLKNDMTMSSGVAAGGKSKSDTDAAQWTQLPSAQFKQPGSKDLFGMNDKGELIYSSDESKDRPFNATNDILGGTGLGKNPQQTFEEYKKALTRPSVERTRIINHLTELGVIDKNADTKTVNSAISNFWNRLANAESSITVAKPGNKAANDILEEYNRTYFGTKTPDSKAKGSSILEGQLAQHTFINEQGKPMTPQQVAKETANRNVRVNGIVDQYKSPFEYGSSYMVASNDEGEQKHYLISPDLNTKNSGAYAANQIYNSINKQGLKSSWTDGSGVSYEATPLEGGKRFAVYVNSDINNPIVIDESTLNQLSQVSPGNVLPALQSLLKR
jgi:hypothetical protein